eukprot:438687_1
MGNFLSQFAILAILLHLFCWLTIVSAVDVCITETQNNKSSYIIHIQNQSFIELNTTFPENNSNIDISIKSHEIECMSPTYMFTYYHDSISIYDHNNKLMKKCNQSSDCKIAEVCTVNDAKNIPMHGTKKITLSTESRGDCSNPTISIKCTDNYQQNYTKISCGTNTSMTPSCYGRNISCPENSNCEINCHNEKKCKYKDGMTSRSCSVCYGASFYCPDNAVCNVSCQGSHACYGAQFYGVNSNVSCDGSWSCLNAVFNYSQINNENNYNVFCNGFSSCLRSKFYLTVGRLRQWIMLTNGDKSEQLILSTYNSIGRIFIVSKYGDSASYLKGINTEYAGFCSECVINTSGYIESSINVIKIVWYNYALLITTLFVLVMYLFYTIIYIYWISKSINYYKYYFPIILFINFYGFILIGSYNRWLDNLFFNLSDWFRTFVLINKGVIRGLITFKLVVTVVIYYQLKSAFKKYIRIPVIPPAYINPPSLIWINSTDYFKKFRDNICSLQWKMIAKIVFFVVGSIVADPITMFYIFRIKPWSVAISKRILVEMISWKSVQLFYILDILCHFWFVFSAIRCIIMVFHFGSYPISAIWYALLIICFFISELLCVCGRIFGIVVTCINVQKLRKETHSFIEMQCSLRDIDEGVNLVGFRTKQLQNFLQTEKYEFEVIEVSSGKVLICVGFNCGSDIDNATIEMESYMTEQLTDHTFLTYIKKYITNCKNKMPIITINGENGQEAVYQYQIAKFEAINEEKCTELSNDFQQMTVLNEMSSLNVIKMITYWLLQDEKNKLYRKEIMNVIKTKNIDSFTMNEQTKKKIKIVNYLQKIIGDYINAETLEKMEQKLQNVSTYHNAHQLGKLICMFPIHTIEEGLYDINGKEIDGKWIVKNMENTRFMNTLQHLTGMRKDDIMQINRFLLKYHITNHNIQTVMLKNIHNVFRQYVTMETIQFAIKKYYIDYQILLFKLRNNKPIDEESECLLNVFDYIIHSMANNMKPKYKLINKVYKTVSKTLCNFGLDEWFCSECSNHNKVMTIFNKKIKPSSSLLNNCILCGFEKITAVTNKLKQNAKTHILENKMAVLTQCKLDGNNEICEYYNYMLNFIKFHAENTRVNCIDILSTLSYSDQIKYIVSPAINSIKNITDKCLLKQFIDDDAKEEKLFNKNDTFLLYLTESELQTIFNQNNNLSITTLKTLYNNIQQQINEFLQKTQKISFASYSKALNEWKHVLEFHSTEFQYIPQCDIANCISLSRHTQRRFHRHNHQQSDDINIYYSNDIKEHLLKEKYYFNEFDIIHLNLFHPHNSETAVTKDFTIEIHLPVLEAIGMETKSSTILSTPTLDNWNEFYSGIGSRRSTMLSVPPKYRNVIEFSSKPLKLIAEESDNSRRNTVWHETEDINAIRNRYTTDVGLYSIGMDYLHHHLGPEKTQKIWCLKSELLKTKYVWQGLWQSKLTKALEKYKLINDNNSLYHSKQFSEEYNICRGDKIGSKHILSICFYTDCSDLCTDYRSSFRRTEYDKNDQDVRNRFRKYYFLSRFLFEAIEFWGEPLRNDQIIHHGLNSELLFESFTSHFHAPISTTPYKESAINFAGQDGIILYLKNGNKGINNKQEIISRFQPNQARFIDVSIYSDYNNECEWLFFGNSIIFEVVDIYHVRYPQQIPPNTLKQLNMLQQIIKNKTIQWQKMEQIVNGLESNLIETRKINEIMIQYEDINDEIDSLERHLQTNSDCDNYFIRQFYLWYSMNEYDCDSFVEDITDIDKKTQSNFYEFLLQSEKSVYFDTIYKLLNKQKEDRLQHQKQPYYLRLFHFFTVRQVEFISISKPFDIPNQLAIQLFQDNNNQSSISITKLTDLFYNVHHIQFDH